MTCAQETYAAADRATIAIIRQCHQDAKQILSENRELLDKIAAYLLKKETITGQEMMAIIEGRDPETVDNYGATREEDQKLFRPSTPGRDRGPRQAHQHRVGAHPHAGLRQPAGGQAGGQTGGQAGRKAPGGPPAGGLPGQGIIAMQKLRDENLIPELLFFYGR